MKLIIVFLFLLQECWSFALPNFGCHVDLTLDNKQYNITDIFLTGNAYPTDAHYDTYGNLFYVESGRNAQGFYFNIKLIEDQSKIARNIEGLPHGISYSIAVDKTNTKVYFGTGEGIFVFDYDTRRATLHSERGLKLDLIFVDKDGNKYITENDNGVEELYLLHGSKKIRFNTLESLNEMAIDEKNNFFFIQNEKLYVLNITQSTPVSFGNVSYNGMAQISIHKDTVFVASQNLYVYKNGSNNLKLVQNMPWKVTAIAFDKMGNFVLGTCGKLLKFMTMKKECYFRQE